MYFRFTCCSYSCRFNDIGFLLAPRPATGPIMNIINSSCKIRPHCLFSIYIEKLRTNASHSAPPKFGTFRTAGSKVVDCRVQLFVFVFYYFVPGPLLFEGLDSSIVDRRNNHSNSQDTNPFLECFIHETEKKQRFQISLSTDVLGDGSPSPFLLETPSPMSIFTPSRSNSFNMMGNLLCIRLCNILNLFSSELRYRNKSYSIFIAWNHISYILIKKINHLWVGKKFQNTRDVKKGHICINGWVPFQAVSIQRWPISSQNGWWVQSSSNQQFLRDAPPNRTPTFMTAYFFIHKMTPEQV